MDLDTKLTVPPQVMSRLVDDETVLLDLESGMYFGLDGVGRRIWECVSEGHTLGETADILTAEYDVEKQRVEADVVEFARDLVDRGLLDASAG